METFIKTLIEQKIRSYKKAGMVTFKERFILKHGRTYKGIPLIGAKGEPKQCYVNATRMVLAGVSKSKQRYVEGFAINMDLGVLMDHAWVGSVNNFAIDPTWSDPENSRYYGVAYTRGELRAAVLKNEVYGLFDLGFGFNFRAVQDRDPEMFEQFVSEEPRIVGHMNYQSRFINLEKEKEYGH